MAKVVISCSNDSRVYEYDSVMKNVKSHVRKDTSFRCYKGMALRLDLFPNTMYHTTYHISNNLFEKIKLITLDDKRSYKNEKVLYGIMIADAIQGFSKSKDFLYNALVTQKYNKPYVLDTMNFYYNNGVMRCMPHGSEVSSYNKTLFENNAGTSYSRIRQLMGVNEGRIDVTDFVEKYNMDKQGKYAGSCYFDTEGIIVTELFEVGGSLI